MSLKALHVDHWNSIGLTSVSKTDSAIETILGDATPQKAHKLIIEMMW
jgi:hypothetical protein